VTENSTNAALVSTTTGNAGISNNYEFAKSFPQEHNGNRFEPEPRNNLNNESENYFVLEKQNLESGVQRNGGYQEDVHNALNDKNKKTAEEYHHIRGIGKSGMDGGDYDKLKGFPTGKNKTTGDDYDHCKPKHAGHIPQCDDYDHLS